MRMNLSLMIAEGSRTVSNDWKECPTSCQRRDGWFSALLRWRSGKKTKSTVGYGEAIGMDWSEQCHS
ncbi:hypothetical protein TNCV_929521 [Trichonephila clavipes]|nr:hypothetical protein TNCV_929521 [Trichonephila clavipes]